MGYAQLRAQEPATQPPEPPQSIVDAGEQIYRSVYRLELATAIHMVDRILAIGKGQLNSCDLDGQDIRYDRADLWESLTNREEPAELAWLLAAIRLPGDTAIIQRAKDLLNNQIREFAELHADQMAAKAEREYLAERGY